MNTLLIIGSIVIGIGIGILGTLWYLTRWWKKNFKF